MGLQKKKKNTHTEKPQKDCSAKENKQQNKKATYRMGEYI